MSNGHSKTAQMDTLVIWELKQKEEKGGRGEMKKESTKWSR